MKRVRKQKMYVCLVKKPDLPFNLSIPSLQTGDHFFVSYKELKELFCNLCKQYY